MHRPGFLSYPVAREEEQEDGRPPGLVRSGTDEASYSSWLNKPLTCKNSVRSSRLALSWEDEGWLGYGPQVKRCLPTRRKRPLQLRQAFAKYVSAETPGCICPAPGLRQSRRPVRVQT